MATRTQTIFRIVMDGKIVAKATQRAGSSEPAEEKRDEAQGEPRR